VRTIVHQKLVISYTFVVVANSQVSCSYRSAQGKVSKALPIYCKINIINNIKCAQLLTQCHVLHRCPFFFYYFANSCSLNPPQIMRIVSLVLVLGSLSLVLALAQRKSERTQTPNPWVVVVLGAQIGTIPGTDEIVPAFHTRSRAAGAAMFVKRGPEGPGQSLILSGGYNVGVRYDLNNTVFAKANFTFAAIAEARWKGPSEARVMAGVVIAPPYNLPLAQVAFEESSATTEENARMTSVMLSRSYFNGTVGVGVLTNLYHLPTAVSLFRANVPSKYAVQPIFAEDWLALDTSEDWTSEMIKYYSVPRGGKLWDFRRIGQIMKQRAQGNLTASLAELL